MAIRNPQRDGLYNYSGLENVRTNLLYNRRSFMGKWNDAASLVAPYRFKRYPEESNSGERRDKRIRRNTAQRSLRTFVSGMQNGNTPRSRPWFRLSTMDEKISHDKRQILSAMTEVIERFLHLSNFYQVLPGYYKDLGVFSNACVAMLPHPKNIFYFYPIPVGQYAIGCGQDGQVNSFVRDYSMTIRQVVERFGKLTPDGRIDWDNSLNGWIKALWETAQYEFRVIITNIILPNPKGRPNAIDPLDRPYHSYSYINRYGGEGGSGIPQHWPNARNAAMGKAGYAINTVWVGGDKAHKDEKDEFILQVSGYDYFPIIAARWETLSNEEPYGVDGPTEIAHGDLLTLNKEQEYRLEAISKLVRPPFIGPASLAGYRVSTSAGGITYFNEMGSDKQLRPLFAIDPKLSELVKSVEETDMFIKEAYYVDLFQPMSQESPISHVSATEIQKRAGESLQMISPVLSQLDEDFNEPVIRNSFFLLNKAGLMPEVPEDLGSPMVPEYISTLAMATKITQANSIDRFANYLATAGEALGDQRMKFVLDGEKSARKYGAVLGVDPITIRSEEAVEDEFEKMQEQQAAMQQQEMEAQKAAMMKDMSQAKLGEGSMLDAAAENADEEGLEQEVV